MPVRYPLRKAFAILLLAQVLSACSAPTSTSPLSSVTKAVEPDTKPETPAPPAVVPRFKSTAPDVTESGPYVISEALEYRFDDYLVSDGETHLTYPADVHGQVRFPSHGRADQDVNGPFPVILFLHGRHVTCNYGGFEFLSSGNCPQIDGMLLRVAPINSYIGYDYMARNLASHGYIVISIDANDINDKDLAGDSGVQERAQLLLHHLDMFRDINKNGGQGFDILKGRMDFDRVGIMGHSRGGDAVTHAIRFNNMRVQALPAYAPSGLPLIGAPSDASFTAKHQLKAVFALAPTDFDRHLATNVTFATLLPYCDGDVSNLQGAWAFDDSRYAEAADSAAKFQLLTMGTNHNYYNTIWVDDDHSGADSFCGAASEKSGRLSPEDQRRHGDFLMSSFFRYFVGNEPQFADYWASQARVPNSACPGGVGPCDSKILQSIHQPAAQRLLIDATKDGTGLTTNALNGPVTLSGFSASSTCTPNGSSGTGCPSQRTYSYAPQVSLTWDSIGASYMSALGDRDVSAFTHITLRAGLAVDDTHNTKDQDMNIVITDSAGKSASVPASTYSDALFLPPGDAANANGAKTTLNMISVPLAAFTGINTKAVSSMKLVFDKTPKGSVQISDMQFQQITNP